MSYFKGWKYSELMPLISHSRRKSHICFRRLMNQNEEMQTNCLWWKQQSLTKWILERLGKEIDRERSTNWQFPALSTCFLQSDKFLLLFCPQQCQCCKIHSVSKKYDFLASTWAESHISHLFCRPSVFHKFLFGCYTTRASVEQQHRRKKCPSEKLVHECPCLHLLMTSI